MLPQHRAGCDNGAMLAIDWGLSSFRAWRLAADGAVTATLTAPRGVNGLARDDFAATLAGLLSPWPGAAAVPALLCGMVGSRQGWVEAPYAPCPARAHDIAAALIPLPGRPGSFVVPGLSCRNGGVADVMRGEETQIVGLLSLLGAGRHTLCLPGTHSKWAVVEDGAIVSFRTAMTGELFALMRRQSTLAPIIPDGGGDDDHDAFAAGAARAADPGGLPHHLFGIRAGALLGDLRPEAAAAFLSGLLIGHEIAALATGAATVHVVGSPALTGRYARALAAAGHGPVIHGEECAARGLAAIAAARGIG
jgi:2-dehydro-3-deoxygalactonokinase